jgi:hypothetical protein
LIPFISCERLSDADPASTAQFHVLGLALGSAKSGSRPQNPAFSALCVQPEGKKCAFPGFNEGRDTCMGLSNVQDSRKGVPIAK